jgi:hypothetical protein
MSLPATSLHDRGTADYERHRPKTTALYELVRDNLDTLYRGINDGALDVKLPKHAKKELEAYLDCGLVCRGFARLWCGSCDESRLVAFSCKGRGFCPSCLGRCMCVDGLPDPQLFSPRIVTLRESTCGREVYLGEVGQ